MQSNAGYAVTLGRALGKGQACRGSYSYAGFQRQGSGHFCRVSHKAAGSDAEREVKYSIWRAGLQIMEVGSTGSKPT